MDQLSSRPPDYWNFSYRTGFFRCQPAQNYKRWTSVETAIPAYEGNYQCYRHSPNETVLEGLLSAPDKCPTDLGRYEMRWNCCYFSEKIRDFRKRIIFFTETNLILDKFHPEALSFQFKSDHARSLLSFVGLVTIHQVY